jgi:hypothetical protein
MYPAASFHVSLHNQVKAVWPTFNDVAVELDGPLLLAVRPELQQGLHHFVVSKPGSYPETNIFADKYLTAIHRSFTGDGPDKMSHLWRVVLEG